MTNRLPTPSRGQPGILAERGTALSARARQLAKALGYPIIQPDQQTDHHLILHITATGLALTFPGQRLRPFRIDFGHPAMLYRYQTAGIRQPLARAVGIKQGVRPSLIDATAGMGRDGFILAMLGCRVTMVERSPLLALLLEDALQRAATNPRLREGTDNTSFLPGNAIDLLPTLPPSDCIYLDPMFPVTGNSALVKKEMRILRHLVGDDMDADKLFRTAMEHGAGRIVVKRHRRAPHIGEGQPSYSLNGKSSRFDVYLCR